MRNLRFTLHPRANQAHASASGHRDAIEPEIEQVLTWVRQNFKYDLHGYSVSYRGSCQFSREGKLVHGDHFLYEVTVSSALAADLQNLMSEFG